MKRLRKLLLFLAAVQVVIMMLGIVLRRRFLSQQLGEGEINAVGVSGRAEEKVTSTDFRGGYVRAVMGGAGITVPEGWKVRVDAGTILGGVDEIGVGDEGEHPDLVLTGKVIMGGVAITHKKPGNVLEEV